MTIYEAIEIFVQIAIKNAVIKVADQIYYRNQLAHFVGVRDWQTPLAVTDDSLAARDVLLATAQVNNQIAAGDDEFFEAALMNFITPLPSQLNETFWAKYQEAPSAATQYFFNLAKEVDQVKTQAIAKNIAFDYSSKYGNLEITINLSKPEKDPKAIAAAKLIKNSGYPACALCVENEGLYGGGSQPARSNHRIVRLELNGEAYGLQYSPYAYYPEHSIVMNVKHKPMEISAQTFVKLLKFVDQFPHYMIGSNADLPIVGGSILSHDHFQAGRHDFPMAKAGLRKQVMLAGFPEIEAGILAWPMSVLRLKSTNEAQLVAASAKILNAWRKYDDLALNIAGRDADGVDHHTITPIVRHQDKNYEVDLVLRDNNVSAQYPDGIFHPHAPLHHIKKENIGLIEVMGLAVLPARLKTELAEVEAYLLDQPANVAPSHQAWADELKQAADFTELNVHAKVQAAVGAVFEQVLEDAGVYKDNPAGLAGFERFITFVNQKG